MRFKLALVLSAILMVTAAGQAHARGTFTGNVTKITSSNSVTNVFIDGTITAVSGESIPGCSSRDDYFTLSPDQKSQLAIALTAMAAGFTVKINGTGSCTNNASVEDVGSLSVNGS